MDAQAWPLEPQSAGPANAPVPAPHALPSVLDVLENTTDAVALFDRDWRFTFLNKHAQRILAPGRNLIGSPLHDLFRPEKGSEAWQKAISAAQTRQSVDFEFYGSEQKTWFEVHVHPIPSGVQIFFRDISARHADARALAEAEERLRLALEASGDGAWDWNIVEDRISMSTRLMQDMGYGVNAFEGPSSIIPELVHPDDVEGARRALLAHLRGRTPAFQAEYRARSRNGGEWRWLLVRGRVIARDPGTGRATRMVGISGDIDDRKRAEERALEQAKLLSLAHTGAGAGAWSLDLSSFTLNLAPETWAKLRRPYENGGNLPLPVWVEIVHPEDIQALNAKILKAILEQTSFDATYRICLPGDRVRWIQSLGSFVRSPSGGADRMLGLALDITENKLAADALRESEERLRLTLEATGDGAWEWNFTTGELIAQSRPIAGTLGYPDGSVTGTTGAYADLIHPDDRERVLRDLKEHLAGRSRSFLSEYRMRAASGEWIWILDRGRAIDRDPHTSRVTRMVGTHSDITSRKLATLELQRMQGELIHLSRLSAMGAMASTLAHELNQPLTALANYVGGLRHIAPDALNSAGLVDEAMQGLEESARRAGEIVRRLRNYVTKGEVDRRCVPMDGIVREACALALVDASALGIQAVVTVAPDLPLVFVDHIQIQQVLLNLIRNAVESLDGCAVRELRIEVTASHPATVEVAVLDTGAGVSPEMREQLFTPFSSSKANGMGVGLSICRTIVEAHGGRIWAEDRSENGTAFRFSLPVCD